MRINKWLASHTSLSRRKADTAIANGQIKINGHTAVLGDMVGPSDRVSQNGQDITSTVRSTELWALHKPVGYICSRDGQGSRTIYDILPEELQHLKSVGRLDKMTSGLLLLTNDGDLMQRLSHPSANHEKVYEVELDQALSDEARRLLVGSGVDIGDARHSRFIVTPKDADKRRWEVVLTEGRNRQIRRTFEALGLQVVKLQRIRFAQYSLGAMRPGAMKKLNTK